MHLDTLDKKLSFLDDIKKVFECVICRATVSAPVSVPTGHSAFKLLQNENAGFCR